MIWGVPRCAAMDAGLSETLDLSRAGAGGSVLIGSSLSGGVSGSSVATAGKTLLGNQLPFCHYFTVRVREPIMEPQNHPLLAIALPPSCWTITVRGQITVWHRSHLSYKCQPQHDKNHQTNVCKSLRQLAQTFP